MSDYSPSWKLPASKICLQGVLFRGFVILAEPWQHNLAPMCLAVSATPAAGLPISSTSRLKRPRLLPTFPKISCLQPRAGPKET